MPPFGKSIRIYLKDGTVTGVKFGEVVNQTIQAIYCPRTRIAELGEHGEAKKPGVYFLFGQDQESGESKVYIGEAENVFNRLKEHVASKEFWSEVIFFVSKDENITKAHVKYLESRAIQLAFAIKRYEVENYNQAQLPALPLADRDAMEEFLGYVKLLLGTLGHKVLEEVSPQLPKTESGMASSEELDPVKGNSKKLFLSINGLKAYATQTDEGIVVLSGSEAALNYTDHLQPGYVKLRQSLLDEGHLMQLDTKCVFQHDVLFKYASPAAAIIVGYNTNGPKNWKNQDGKSLKQLEEEKLDKSLETASVSTL